MNITSLVLSYGSTQTVSEYAFRTAVFAEDIGTALAATTGNVGTLKSILKPGSASYFGAGGATSTTGVAAVSNLSSPAIIGEVAASTTHYYKVVVRLWLEGEDTTCNNTTFATLTDKWALDLSIDMQANTTAAVEALTTSATAEKINLATATATETTVVVDGVTYYQLASPNQAYYSNTSSFTYASRVFQMVNGHPVEVTHKCTLPAQA